MVDATAEAILLSFPAAFALPLVEIVPGDVRDEVGGPATELLVDKVEGSGNRCLLGKFVELMQKMAIAGSIVFSRLWYEDHVSLQMTSRLVVLTMRDLPGEVRHQQS